MDKKEEAKKEQQTEHPKRDWHNRLQSAEKTQSDQSGASQAGLNWAGSSWAGGRER